MPEVNFGEWLPDLPDRNNPGATIATNVVPHRMSYKSFPAGVVVSDALTGRCRGAFGARDNAGNVTNFAGDDTKLYRVVAAVQTDSSKSGGYTVGTDDAWEFTQFGEEVFACQLGDPIQTMTLGSPPFADLITSTLKPTAAHMGIVRGFLVLGKTKESAVVYPNRVRWSALEDPNDFDQSATTQSDFQDLYSSEGGGDIQAVLGGEYGIIIQERSVWRMSYVGGNIIFQFDEVQMNRGAFAAGSVSRYGRLVFYMAEDGMYMMVDGVDSRPIGKNKIDDFLLNEFDTNNKHRVSSAIDPTRSLYLMSYPSTAATTEGDPDKILVYNWSTERFSIIETNHECLFAALTPGLTLEQLDTINPNLDEFTVSLDSRIWTGGNVILSAYDSDSKLNNFSGAALDWTLETTEVQPYPGRRSLVNDVRPLIEGSAAVPKVQVGTRNLPNAAHSFGSLIAQNANGSCPTLIDARYFRFRVAGTGEFENAVGVDVTARQRGIQ